MTDYFELGRITKPQGIKGEVKVEAYTDGLERFLGLEYVYFKSGDVYEQVTVDAARIDGKNAYLLINGIADRNDAEKLRGRYIYIDRAHAARLPEGSYYICDLIGMEVFGDNGEKLGVLGDILQTGSKDVYVVQADGGGTIMFPSVDGVITSRDVESKRMDVCAEELEKVAVYDI